ncbi:MAG: ABC transporter permease subunit [Defluviitaleaceae bacterium]|nr:ABC transporter permease subunit [Defluviitaleaceae bacterium]
MISRIRDYDYKYLKKRIKRSKYLLLMLLLPVTWYIIFNYIPIYGLLIAFQDFNLRLGITGSRWVGLMHFRRFFDHPFFWRLIRNTFLLNLYGLVWGFPMPIIFALLLNELRNVYFKRFVQTVSYLPHFISTVAVVGMLFMILSPSVGIVNQIISAMGGDTIHFLARAEWFRSLFIGSGIWQSMGWGAIIYLAALSGVSEEIYEAATIDGATRLQKIRHISLPSIMPTITILLIMNVGSMMSSATERVLLMQSPITFETSDVIGTFVFRMGLGMADFSFGTAVGLFNSVINLTLLFMANAFSRKILGNSLW